MSQAGSISTILPLPDAMADSPDRNGGVSMAKRVALLFAVAILSTIGGCCWLFQGGVGASAPLQSGAQGGQEVPLLIPLILVLGVWLGAALLAVRFVRDWEIGLVHSAQQKAAALALHARNLEHQLKRTDQLARSSREHSDDLACQVRELESRNAALQDQLDRHALQAKSLAQQQMMLARSKDILEQRVEVRTRELLGQRRRYESILNSAGEGICSVDLEGRIAFVNPAATGMTGWSPEELLGRHESEVFENFDSKPAKPVEGELIARMSPPLFRRKDGSRFPIEMVRTPVEEDQCRVGTVLIFKDVTERTEAMNQLAQKAAELARSNAELEQFAFVASHDLQEPLRKIQAFGDRLKVRSGDALNADSRDYLQRMQSASARMQVLIEDLLTYSRVMTRAQPHGPVDLNTITAEVLGDLEVRIEKANAVVEVDKLPTIEADGLQIRQLLQNLISNALKFQPPGNTPRVRISARMLTHQNAQSRDGSHTTVFTREEMCELTVEDNGIGFDEAYLDRLFAVFQRLHGRDEYEGTGIGLAVCRRIVNRHRGIITARSTPGKGAQFIVTLPLKQPQPRNPA